jgi:hypothetical protein
VRDRVAFSTSYPELNTAVLGHTDNERFVGKPEVIARHGAVIDVFQH